MEVKIFLHWWKKQITFNSVAKCYYFWLLTTVSRNAIRRYLSSAFPQEVPYLPNLISHTSHVNQFIYCSNIKEKLGQIALNKKRKKPILDKGYVKTQNFPSPSSGQENNRCGGNLLILF